MIHKHNVNGMCERTHSALALSGGGDSIGVLFCLLRSLKVINRITINHNLRFESFNDLRCTLASIVDLNVDCANTCLRNQRLNLLSKLVCILGHWNFQTAHTLNDNIENLFGRNINYSAYSLCIPYSWIKLKTEFKKPWATSKPRAHTRARYINDIANADANSLRALWRQLNERAHARIRMSVLARPRLTSVLY
ncbi:tRNA(Ile)-lysidine synthetase [Candidatus Hodgkinia cicadicola]|nr:tRNA(Ile)-lysidine synthetase [Candidatus Hodgkinia cicadicola]